MDSPRSASPPSAANACAWRERSFVFLLAAQVALTLAWAGLARADDEPASGAPLSLAQCLDLARSHNAQLAAERGRHAEAQADVRAAGLWPNPELSAGHTTSTPHQSLILTQAVPLFGKRGRAIDVARGAMAEADLDIEAKDRELRRAVRLHYYGLLFAQRSLDIGQQSADDQRQIESVAKARFEAQDVPELEVKQASLQALTAEAALKALQTDLDAARRQLNVDLGRPAESPLTLAGKLDDVPPIPDLPGLLPRALKEGLSERQVAQQQATARAKLRLARTLALPDLTLGAGVEREDPEFSSGPQYSIGLTIPLWNHGQADRARAKAELDRLALSKKATDQGLQASIGSAQAKLSSAREQVQLYGEKLAPGARSVHDLYQEAYREGEVGLITVLDAARSAREAELGYAQAFLDYQTTLADLEREAGVELDHD